MIARRSDGSGGIGPAAAINRYSVGAMQSTFTCSRAIVASRRAGSNRSSCSSAAAPPSHGEMKELRADFDHPGAAVDHTSSPGRAAIHSRACSAWPRT